MRGNLALAIAVAAATLLLAGSASAEEPAAPTRAEYVGQVEPICQANTEANKRILKNVREKAKDGKLKQAGGQFIRASEAFGSTVAKISEVPRPPADDARLLKWFTHLNIITTDLRKLGKALRMEDKILAAHEGIRVERAGNAANNVGFIFEFHYCRISPGRFTS
jgi:hypothetical protein